LTVENPKKLKPGKWVRLYMNDMLDVPVNESLASSLYDHQVEQSVCGTNCLKALRGVKEIRWAVKIKAIKGNKIMFYRSLPMDVNPRWNAQLHELPPQMPQDCGIQDLTIQFASKRMNPHLKEAGYNGIVVRNAFNSWVRNIVVINSDDGVLVRNSHHVTVSGIDIYANKNRTIDTHMPQGHIGIGLYEATDVEVTNFNISTKMIHDTSVRGTIMCVFHRGFGKDLNLDSHRAAPYGTLYSELDLGAATRVFTSGGAGTNGFPAAAYTTYWNLKTGNESAGMIYVPTKTRYGECTYGAKLVFQGKFIGQGCKTYYMGQNERPTPENLFTSQVSRRLSKEI
jgi:hypothetical protein